MADPKLIIRGEETRKKILSFVGWHEVAFGIGPTLTRVTESTGLSRIATRKHVLRLVEEGWVTYQPRGVVSLANPMLVKAEDGMEWRLVFQPTKLL